MKFTIKPENPKGTVVLVAVLAGTLVWIATMNGSTKNAGSSAPAGAATAAAAAPAEAALTGAAGVTVFGGGPDGSDEPSADTTFAGSPFLTADSAFEEYPDETVEENRPEEPALVLSGTVVQSGRSLALISGRYLAPGEDINGWRLQWVASREARLERGGRTLTLRMDRNDSE